MNYWLLKSEPNTWSWENQKKKITEHWDGVRNWTAAKNMKSILCQAKQQLLLFLKSR